MNWGYEWLESESRRQEYQQNRIEKKKKYVGLMCVSLKKKNKKEQDYELRRDLSWQKI